MSVEHSEFKKYSSKSLKEVTKMGGSGQNFDLARIWSDKYGKTKGQSNLLFNYFLLLTNTNFLREDMYDYLVHNLSYKQLEEKYKKNNYNNIVARTVKKIFDCIGNDILYTILYENPSEENIIALDTHIINLLNSHENFKEVKNKSIFSINFENFSKIDMKFNAQISDASFEEVAEVLKPYVITYQNIIFDQLEPEHFGYIYHLINSPLDNLSDTDKRRRKKLEADWFIDFQ